MSKTVIAFNGEPHCGKDTISKLLLDLVDGYADSHPYIIRCSYKLQQQACVLSGINKKEWAERYDATRKEDNGSVTHMKNVPWDKLSGMSQREWVCYIAEEVVKPKLGKDFYAKDIVSSIVSSHYDFVIIPDIGFESEVLELCNHVDIEKVILVHITKDDQTEHIKDTRKDLTYITHDKLFVRRVTNYHNNLVKTMEEFSSLVQPLVKYDIGGNSKFERIDH